MRFGQQIALTYVVRTLLIPLGVLNAVIVARWLGPEGKGTLVAITAYLAMAGTFGSLGLATEATRVSAADPRRTGALLANARLTGGLTGLLALAVLLAPQAVGQSTTSSGVSNAFNPAVSVNALLLGRLADNSTDRTYNALDLQEAEVQFTSIVDPFWKAKLIFAVHPAHSHDHEEDAEAVADHGAHTDLGYPSVCLTGDGHVLIAYYINSPDVRDRWIECKRIPLSRLR